MSQQNLSSIPSREHVRHVIRSLSRDRLFCVTSEYGPFDFERCRVFVGGSDGIMREVELHSSERRTRSSGVELITSEGTLRLAGMDLFELPRWTALGGTLPVELISLDVKQVDVGQESGRLKLKPHL